MHTLDLTTYLFFSQRSTHSHTHTHTHKHTHANTHTRSLSQSFAFSKNHPSFNVVKLFTRVSYTHRQLIQQDRLMVYTKVAGVLGISEKTWNFRYHAVSACSNHMISPWCHRPMHALTACIAPWHHRPILYWLSYFNFIKDIPLLQLLWVHTACLVVNVSSVSGRSNNIGSQSRHIYWPSPPALSAQLPSFGLVVCACHLHSLL